MTTQLPPDRAMDALVSLRPESDELDHAWYIGRREAVLQRVLNAPGVPAAHPSARHRASRRWGLVAAAIALIATFGLLAQVLLPLGAPGSPQTAQALDRLAAAVPTADAIPEGSYELSTYTEAGIAESEDGPFRYQTRRSTWMAADGWAWAHQTGDDAAWYVFEPAPRNYDLNQVPANPAVMEAYLRARVMGSSSVEEALFEAVKSTLTFTPTPAATRAAAIRMLTNVPGVTVVEHTTDPDGRAATEVRFVDEEHRPGMTNSMFLDPTDTQLLAELQTQDGAAYYTCRYVERRIVASLPEDIVRTLGTERTPKSIDG